MHYISLCQSIHFRICCWCWKNEFISSCCAPLHFGCIYRAYVITIISTVVIHSQLNFPRNCVFSLKNCAIKTLTDPWSSDLNLTHVKRYPYRLGTYVIKLPSVITAQIPQNVSCHRLFPFRKIFTDNGDRPILLTSTDSLFYETALL